MKDIKAYVKEDYGILGCTIAITDDDAIDAVFQLSWTGFNLKDALKNANQKLNPNGFNVTME